MRNSKIQPNRGHALNLTTWEAKSRLLLNC